MEKIDPDIFLEQLERSSGMYYYIFTDCGCYPDEDGITPIRTFESADETTNFLTSRWMTRTDFLPGSEPLCLRDGDDVALVEEAEGKANEILDESPEGWLIETPFGNNQGCCQYFLYVSVTHYERVPLTQNELEMIFPPSHISLPPRLPQMERYQRVETLIHREQEELDLILEQVDPELRAQILFDLTSEGIEEIADELAEQYEGYRTLFLSAIAPCPSDSDEEED